MITVGKLKQMLEEMPDNLQIFAYHGASGAINPIGSVYLDKAIESDIDMGLDLEEGEKYVILYIGN